MPTSLFGNRHASARASAAASRNADAFASGDKGEFRDVVLEREDLRALREVDDGDRHVATMSAELVRQLDAGGRRSHDQHAARFQL